jgi:hypothetical protein
VVILFPFGQYVDFNKTTDIHLGADDYLLIPFNFVEMEVCVSSRVPKVLDQTKWLGSFITERDLGLGREP